MSDGFVQLSGALAGKVSYFGLEPVRTIFRQAIASSPSMEEQKRSAVRCSRANMKIDSTLGEVVTFANPTTNSLTINAGRDDFIQIQSIDTMVRLMVISQSMAMSATIPSFPRQP